MNRKFSFQVRSGYFHNAEVGSHGVEIEFFEEVPIAANQGWWGPFKTWSEAKKDAIAYFQSDINDARLAIRSIKKMRKPKK